MTTFHQTSNNAVGTIQNNPLTSGGTNLQVNSELDTKLSALSFPFYLTLWTANSNPNTDTALEIVEVTARPSPNNYTIARGKQGTTGVDHSLNDSVGLFWTQGNINEVLASGTVSQGALYAINSSGLPYLLQPGTAGYLLSSGGAGADNAWIPSPTAKISESASAVTQTGNTTENTIDTIAIPAGTLGTSNVVNYEAEYTYTNLANTNTCTLRFKYGSTTIATVVITANSNNDITGRIKFNLYANASASVQYGKGLALADNFATRYTNFGAGTGAENSANALNLVMTAQMNNSANVFTRAAYVTSVIK